MTISDLQKKFSSSCCTYNIYSTINLDELDLPKGGGGSKSDYDEIGGYAVIFIPSHSTLDFKGGLIKGGTIVLDSTHVNCGIDVNNIIQSEICGDFRQGQVIYDEDSKTVQIWDGKQWVDFTGQPIENPKFPLCTDPPKAIKVTPDIIEASGNGATTSLNIICRGDWSIE